MFIQTEETPNPNTLKFIPGVTVLGPGQTENFKSAAEAKRAPLAESLFQIPSVSAVFMGADFISVTKEETTDWSTLKIQILSVIMDYFVRHQTVEIHSPDSPSQSGKPGENGTEPSTQGETALEKEIKELLDSRVRPAVAQDGGDIIFDRFEQGVVYLRMQGACEGCPSATATLKSGIENMLRYYIPEVTEVRSVT